ncbi:MAG: hypothetical protein WCT77_04130 [Bacteroidota bacterium]
MKAIIDGKKRNAELIGKCGDTYVYQLDGWEEYVTPIKIKKCRTQKKR